MKKYYISGIVIIILVVSFYAYLRNNVTCYDGYGSGQYFSRAEFFKKIDNGVTPQEDFSTMLKDLNDDKLAFENYRCGGTNYLIKNGNKFKEVSKINFQNFVNENSSGLVKIWQSGNSPYFVDDISTGKKYYFSIENGKYVLTERKQV